MTPFNANALVDIRTRAKKVLTTKSAFANCSPAVIEAIVAKSVIMTYDVGDPIFTQGESGDHMMVIVSGAAKVSRRAKDGTELELGYVKRGAVIGELAALDGRERTADVTALEPTKAVAIYRKHLRPILEANPDAMFGLLESFCGRLRWTNALAESFAQSNKPASSKEDVAAERCVA